jgi:hypothetical protein
MPNWCEGYLKIRGKKEDIVNFVENEIRLVKSENIFSEPEYLEIKMIDDLGEYRFNHTNSFREYLHLKNTRRFFVESEEISFYYYEDEVCHLTLEIKQAWAIDIQELLVEHSKKYNVDFNIYASEMGMEFEQYITVVNGKLLKDEERIYIDFQFEAINPNLGG